MLLEAAGKSFFNFICMRAHFPLCRLDLECSSLASNKHRGAGIPDNKNRIDDYAKGGRLGEVCP